MIHITEEIKTRILQHHYQKGRCFLFYTSITDSHVFGLSTTTNATHPTKPIKDTRKEKLQKRKIYKKKKIDFESQAVVCLHLA